MPCKHADLMMIYAKQAAEMDEPWKLWEWKMNVDNHWNKLFINPVWDKHTEYRQIPKTININGHEVPEPMRDRPEIGSRYYFVSARIDCSDTQTWTNDDTDNLRLQLGLCHLTKEAAIAHAKALFSFTEVV